uniref:Uncharacterized protein n=1 Tax=Oryza punctata TaxID=4537 RepID=A0A0E0LCE5_ORYPU
MGRGAGKDTNAPLATETSEFSRPKKGADQRQYWLLLHLHAAALKGVLVDEPVWSAAWEYRIGSRTQGGPTTYNRSRWLWRVDASARGGG